MKEIDVIRLLRLMGYEDHEMVVRDEWVNIICPLVDKKHKPGQRSLTSPSAGISINPKGESRFKCFSCTPRPTKLLDLIISKSLENGYTDRSLALFYQSKEIFEDTEEERSDEEIFDAGSFSKLLRFNKWIPERKKDDNEIKKVEMEAKFPDELLVHFPLLAPAVDNTALLIKNFLINTRGVSLSSIAELGVRYHKEKNLIIFPLTDLKGNIQVLRARKCDPKNKAMFTISSKMANNKFNLPNIRDTGASFGLHKIDSTKPIIIVEAEIDCLLLKTYGFPNVIATTSASFSRSQIQNLPSSNLWLGFDNDDAGRRAAKNLISSFNGKLIHVINWGHSGGKDPGDAENRLDIMRAINKKVLIEKKHLTKFKKYANGI